MRNHAEGSDVGAGFKPAPTERNRNERPRRRSLRLRGYDYACSGAYFVTVCAYRRICLFGCIADGVMHSNVFGTIIETCWHGLPQHYPHVELDGFVVMPNHVHGILFLTDDVVTGRSNSKRHGLPEIIRAFKTFSARRINALRGGAGSLWQRGYYEHVIRNEESLREIRSYIETNPLRWDLDQENPNVRRGGFQTRPYNRD